MYLAQKQLENLRPTLKPGKAVVIYGATLTLYPLAQLEIGAIEQHHETVERLENRLV